jgi:Protein of unknown function (DUF1203)
MMIPFRVLAIPTTVAQSVRDTMRSPRYGHPAHSEVATGYGPCRHCLHTFTVGVDRRLLFTYDAFAEHDSLPLPGPVFVHAEACERYPEDAGFPEELREHALTLNAYATGRRFLAQEYATGHEVDSAIQRLLGRLEVDYIHVRDTQAGCYDCRIERSHRA